MKKLIIEKPAFVTDEGREHFICGSDGWDWHYNITKNLFGYGDDARDWHHKGDEFITSHQIEDITDMGGDVWEIYYEDQNDQTPA